MKRNELTAKICVDYIKHFIGKPYIWSGNNVTVGADCSGTACEFLKCAGILKERDDYSAEGLKVLLAQYKVENPVIGALVFFGRTKATHIAICISGTHMIEAAGGGSETDTIAEAQENLAFIKIRPINKRKDILGYADPFLL